jgi:hypothetical protein
MGFLFSTPKIEQVLQETHRLLRESKASEAAEILRRAEKKNVYHPDYPLLWSKIHTITGNHTECHKSIEHHLSLNNEDVLHHLKAVDSLIEDGLFELAQSFLDRTKQRFPLSGFPHHAQAKLHCEQCQFEAAAESLLKKQQYGKLEDADVAILHQIRKGVAGNFQQYSQELFSTTQAQVVLKRFSYERFESLGIDCEFGFLQRHFGREPLSLFRWGAMSLASLLKLFRQDFKDFASPETTKLNLLFDADTGQTEYRFLDTQYGYEAHTFYTKRNISIAETEDSLLPKVRSHFSLLARKLQEDLEDAEKIFLYKSNEALSIAQYQELHLAMRNIGPCKLLVVLKQKNQEASAHPLEIIAPDLVIGYVDYFWTDSDNPTAPNPSVASWDNMIQHAYSHFIAHFPELETA